MWHYFCKFLSYPFLDDVIVEIQMHSHIQHYLSFCMFAESISFNPTFTSFLFSVIIIFGYGALLFAKIYTKLF